MYFISSRRSFWYSSALSTSDETYSIELSSDEGADGATYEIALHSVNSAQLQAAVVGKRVLLLVHGYNNATAATLSSYRQILKGMRLHGPTYDIVVGYIWPGEWMFTEFSDAVATAEGLADRVRQNLLDLQGATSIDVCAHSLGNLVVLGALTKGGVHLRNMFALAPAIEHDALDMHGILYEASTHCEQLHVLHSRHDWVLSLGYQRFKATPALGLNGPPLPDRTAASVFVVDSQRLVTGVGRGTAHSQYRRLPEMYKLMARAAVSHPQKKRFSLDALDDADWAERA